MPSYEEKQEKSKNRLPIFQERFSKLRGEMSQAEFAAFLGIARPTVGFYENGERLPDALVLKKIAEKCNVSVDWLLGLSEASTQDADVQYIHKKTGLSEEVIELLSPERGRCTLMMVSDGGANENIVMADFINKLVVNKKTQRAAQRAYRLKEYALKGLIADKRELSDIEAKEFESKLKQAHELAKYIYGANAVILTHCENVRYIISNIKTNMIEAIADIINENDIEEFLYSRDYGQYFKIKKGTKGGDLSGEHTEDSGEEWHLV